MGADRDVGKKLSVVDSFHKKHYTCLHGRKIIILDDIPEIALIFKRALELSGLEVVLVAHTGEEMLDQLLKPEVKEIDFALIDYNLKGGLINGLQAAVLLQKKKPNIRIVIISAEDFVEMEARSLGFHFLKKPVGLNELLGTLD